MAFYTYQLLLVSQHANYPEAIQMSSMVIPSTEASCRPWSAGCSANPVDSVDLQEAAAAAKAAEDKAAQDEIDRQQRIKDSFDTHMPDEISQQVQAALQKEMVSHDVCRKLHSCWNNGTVAY